MDHDEEPPNHVGDTPFSGGYDGTTSPSSRRGMVLLLALVFGLLILMFLMTLGIHGNHTGGRGH